MTLQAKLAWFVPQFGNVEHNDNAVSAFVHVDKVSVEARVVRVLQQKSVCHKSAILLTLLLLLLLLLLLPFSGHFSR